MNLFFRLCFILLFQLSSLSAAANMVQMNSWNEQQVGEIRLSDADVSDHCEQNEDYGSHCHCFVCVALVDTSLPSSQEGNAYSFIGKALNLIEQPHSLFRPPQ